MSLNENLKQCRIVIRDTAKGETIADTTIASHDMEAGRIELEGVSLECGITVSALVFSRSGLLETRGTVVEGDRNGTVIVFYEDSGMDDRNAVRYQVNISGNADLIVRQGEKIPESFAVNVRNMSSIGLLLQAPTGCIQEGDDIHFSAVTKGQKIVITAHVQRVEADEDGTEKAGCTVMLVNLG